MCYLSQHVLWVSGYCVISIYSGLIVVFIASNLVAPFKTNKNLLYRRPKSTTVNPKQMHTHTHTRIVLVHFYGLVFRPKKNPIFIFCGGEDNNYVYFSGLQKWWWEKQKCVKKSHAFEGAKNAFQAPPNPSSTHSRCLTCSATVIEQWCIFLLFQCQKIKINHL